MPVVQGLVIALAFGGGVFSLNLFSHATPNSHEVLSQASGAFGEIAERAMPSVVSVSTIRQIQPEPAFFPGLPNLGKDPTPDLQDSHSIMDPRLLGLGSGIVIRKDGLILTNYHVVEHAERVMVAFDEKHKVKAHVVGLDPKTDLAVVQIDPPKKGTPIEYPVLSFGNSDLIRPGDWALAIGSPFGLNRSMSFGIVSAKGRGNMGMLDVDDFIQTDAAINPGSSGGPLLNTQGEVIGINTAIFSQSGGNMGIGFAIPSKTAREVADQIIQHGRVIRGWVGMVAQDLDADLAHFFKAPSPDGALVSQLVANGPAEQSALLAGDVITRFNQQRVDSAKTLKGLVGKTPGGSQVVVGYLRNGKSGVVTLTVQEQPRKDQALSAKQLAGQVGHTSKPPGLPLGVQVRDVPEEIASFLNLPKQKGTLIIAVEAGGPFFDAGLSAGDIILAANKKEIHGASEFNKLAPQLQKQPVAVFYVQRGPYERVFVPVKLRDEA
ncbi:trypsin-like peptidase domain-containing protein [Bdellovibrionota bacterium FG-1]